MNLTEDELSQLREWWGTDRHNEIVDAIKDLRNGQYPPDWGEKVILNPEFDTTMTMSLYDFDGNLIKTIKG